MSEISIQTGSQCAEEAHITVTCKFVYSKLETDAGSIKEAFKELMAGFAI